MNKFIKLPLIREWSYKSRPCDSRPILAENGILLNLDRVTKINPHSFKLTVIDGNSIPLPLEKIQRAWEDFARPLNEIGSDAPPIPYDPSWEGEFEHQQTV